MASWMFLTKLHCAVYRGTRGLVGSNLIGIQVLLLTTRGCLSGETQTQPLAYAEDDGDYVVVAANGSGPHPPTWWLDLQRAPTAEVQVGAERFEASWDVAPKERRTAYWRKLQAAVPAYRAYRDQAEPEIPIVLLKRQIRIPTDAREAPSWRRQQLAPSQARATAHSLLER